MFRFPRPQPLMLGSLVGAAFCLSLTLHTRQIQHQHTSTLGRVSAQQVLQQSQPLCHIIAPWADTLYFNLEPMHGYPRNTWTVVCTDEASREVANLIWDADTGQLVVAGVSPHSLHPSQSVRLSRSVAVAKAWYWLQSLGLAQRASGWLVMRAPQCVHRQVWTWSVQWQGGQQRASIEMEASSGDLLLCAIWHVR